MLGIYTKYGICIMYSVCSKYCMYSMYCMYSVCIIGVRFPRFPPFFVGEDLNQISVLGMARTMTTKRELEARLEVAEEIIAKQEELASMTNTVTTSKIQVGTAFVTICEVGDYTASFMPKSKKYPVPSIWVSKGNKNGLAIPATKKGMETLVAIANLIEEKAELTA